MIGCISRESSERRERERTERERVARLEEMLFPLSFVRNGENTMAMRCLQD